MCLGIMARKLSASCSVLIGMSNLQENGIPGIKPGAFSYTAAVIDACGMVGEVWS